MEAKGAKCAWSPSCALVEAVLQHIRFRGC